MTLPVTPATNIEIRKHQWLSLVSWCLYVGVCRYSLHNTTTDVNLLPRRQVSYPSFYSKHNTDSSKGGQNEDLDRERVVIVISTHSCILHWSCLFHCVAAGRLIMIILFARTYIHTTFVETLCYIRSWSALMPAPIEMSHNRKYHTQWICFQNFVIALLQRCDMNSCWAWCAVFSSCPWVADI